MFTVQCALIFYSKSCLFSAPVVSSSDIPVPTSTQTVNMDLATADLAVIKAIEKAEEIGGKYSIAVLDAGVNLVAFRRMDGGRVGTIDVAMKKVTLQFA